MNLRQRLIETLILGRPDKIPFGGGIDKRALAAGGEVTRAELLRVIPPLLEEGRFMPGCDHGVPPRYPSQTE